MTPHIRLHRHPDMSTKSKRVQCACRIRWGDLSELCITPGAPPFAAEPFLSEVPYALLGSRISRDRDRGGHLWIWWSGRGRGRNCEGPFLPLPHPVHRFPFHRIAATSLSAGESTGSV